MYMYITGTTYLLTLYTYIVYTHIAIAYNCRIKTKQQPNSWRNQSVGLHKLVNNWFWI